MILGQGHTPTPCLIDVNDPWKTLKVTDYNLYFIYEKIFLSSPEDILTDFREKEREGEGEKR